MLRASDPGNGALFAVRVENNPGRAPLSLGFQASVKSESELACSKAVQLIIGRFLALCASSSFQSLTVALDKGSVSPVYPSNLKEKLTLPVEILEKPAYKQLIA